MLLFRETVPVRQRNISFSEFKANVNVNVGAMTSLNAQQLEQVLVVKIGGRLELSE